MMKGIFKHYLLAKFSISRQPTHSFTHFVSIHSFKVETEIAIVSKSSFVTCVLFVPTNASRCRLCTFSFLQMPLLYFFTLLIFTRYTPVRNGVVYWRGKTVSHVKYFSLESSDSDQSTKCGSWIGIWQIFANRALVLYHTYRLYVFQSWQRSQRWKSVIR